MSDYVVMPKADWKNALDSVRAKALITDLIKSGELATVIDNITALNIPQLTHLTGGTVVPASTLSSGSLTIEHNLGVAPNFVVFMSNGYVEESYALQFYARIPIPNYDPQALSNPYSGGYVRGYCNSNAYGIEAASSYTLNDLTSKTTISIPANSTKGQIISGKEYYWICGRIE